MKVIRRGKGRYANSFTVRDQYKEFHNRYKGTKFDLPYKQFKQLVSDFNDALIHHIIKDCGEFKIPFRLGKITIKKKKLNFDDIKRLPIDWVKTRELGTHVRLLNEHTNEYRYKVHWDKKSCIVKGKTIWAFIPTRKFFRTIAYEIKYNNLDYFAI